MCSKKEQDKPSEKDFKESNISNFPDEKLKGMIIKMLVKIRGRMDEQSENFNREEKIKVPNKSHRAEEYNNWIEKYSKRAQQQTK